MCGPVAGLLQGGIGAMSAIAGYNAKVEDFNAREAAWKENYVSALASGRDEENQLTTKAVQEQSATVQKMGVYTTEGAVKAAAVETSAAGAGVGGNSVDDVIRDIQAGAARNRYASQENAHFMAAQIAAEQKGVEAQIKNRINSVQRPTAPNPGEAILGVAGAMLGGIGGM